METIENLLFEQFADALNGELAEVGATLRVDRRAPASGSGMMLIDARAQKVGWLPEHADVAIIVAVEQLIKNPVDDHFAK